MVACAAPSPHASTYCSAMLWRALKGQLHTMRMQACHASGRRARRSRSSCVSSHSCARSEPAHPGPVRRLWGVAAPVWGGAPRGVDDLHGKGVRDRYEGCRSTGRGLADGRWGGVAHRGWVVVSQAARSGLGGARRVWLELVGYVMCQSGDGHALAAGGRKAGVLEFQPAAYPPPRETHSVVQDARRHRHRQSWPQPGRI